MTTDLHDGGAPATAATDMGWLVDRFVRETPGVLHAVVVSVDGLLVAMDATCDRAVADQLAAVVAGLNQMSAGAGQVFGAGELQQQLVQYAAGYILLRSLARGSVMAAVAERRCDMAQVGHELATLARQVGEALSPQLITELRQGLRT
jgi:predicted regulator of Ras-like GTPase activity (Roadblock/LC7/MglB family)